MRSIKDLKREANSLSRGTRQSSAVGLEGRPSPLENCLVIPPLGITRTPTLWVSAGLLDLHGPPGRSPHPVG